MDTFIKIWSQKKVLRDLIYDTLYCSWLQYVVAVYFSNHDELIPQVPHLPVYHRTWLWSQVWMSTSDVQWQDSPFPVWHGSVQVTSCPFIWDRGCSPMAHYWSDRLRVLLTGGNTPVLSATNKGNQPMADSTLMLWVCIQTVDYVKMGELADPILWTLCIMTNYDVTYIVS